INNNVVEPSIPVKNGYIFAGWYSDAELKTAFSFATAITSNTILYAKWISTSGSIDECFIATAAFGSKLQPAVVLLRQFRDKYLLANNAGQKFVAFYYQNSPPIAAFIAQNKPLKALVRVLLLPIIALAYSALHPELFGLFACMILFWMLYRRKVS
ncbi:InlB B-repeat-containing protein, partial [Bacteroides sp.]|uniref:InlB B-repeat-containing protein n=1 Tax=Bacteroides sp. TaxID=29523 RepID=UPI002601FE26